MCRLFSPGEAGAWESTFLTLSKSDFTWEAPATCPFRHFEWENKTLLSTASESCSLIRAPEVSVTQPERQKSPSKHQVSAAVPKIVHEPVVRLCSEGQCAIGRLTARTPASPPDTHTKVSRSPANGKTSLVASPGRDKGGGDPRAQFRQPSRAAHKHIVGSVNAAALSGVDALPVPSLIKFLPGSGSLRQHPPKDRYDLRSGDHQLLHGKSFTQASPNTAWSRVPGHHFAGAAGGSPKAKTSRRIPSCSVASVWSHQCISSGAKPSAFFSSAQEAVRANGAQSSREV